MKRMRIILRDHMTRVLGIIFASLLSLTAMLVPVSAHESESSEVRLPAVTGQHGVGTAVWHWIEGTQEIMAQLWYPGETSSVSSSRYRPLGGAAFESVRQNAVAAAPFADLSGKAPLIVLCPGRGTNRYYYTTIAEDLASRGFAVFTVDIPEIGYVEFPDGRIVEPSEAYRPTFELITGPYEKVDEFFELAVRIGLAHLRFALDRLAELGEADPTGRLTGRLSFESIGAFGHSLGGRICGALAGSDESVSALAAMEGVPPRKVRQVGISAASLMIYSTELPEEMALPNIRELYDNRIAEATILRLEGMGHNSVTDRPLIFRDSFDYKVDPARGLEVTRIILSAFFEAHLADGTFSPVDLASMPEVTIVETSVGLTE